jgi:hypothetical protein
VAASAVAGVLDGYSSIGVSGDYAMYDSYQWRGFELDSDPVAQTGLNIAYDILTLSVWNSQDIGQSDGVDSAEVDYCIDITKSFGDVSVSIGHTYYDFPAADLFSKEYYVGVGFDTFLSPSLTYYRDYGDEAKGGGDGEYVSLGLGYSIPVVSDVLNLDLGSSVGYNNELFLEGTGGDVALNAALGIGLRGGLSLTPSVNYVMPYGDLADEDIGGQEEAFYAGFGMGYEF